MKDFDKPFKQDKNSIWYLDNKDINIESFSFNDIVKSYANRTQFFRIEGINDYIIKDTTLYPLFFNTIKTMNVLKGLINKQRNLPNIDFPVGYFRKGNQIKGMIVPYYQDALSIRKLIYLHKFSELEEYYHHENNEIHNLISLLLDILELVNSMYRENIFYLDIHSGNFLIYQNEIKVIDFEPGFVYFDHKKEKYHERIINNYADLVRIILRKFGFSRVDFYPGTDFDEAKNNVQVLKKHLGR